MSSNPTFINIGERTNVTGSAKFKKLILSNNFDQAIEVAKERKITTIIISHKNSILDVVDKILILKDGMVASFGSKKEVLEKIQKAQTMSLSNK